MPDQGERRTVNGQLAEWDGKGWLPVTEDPVTPTPAIRRGGQGQALGRGTQFDPEQAARGMGKTYDLATTPLARPTGVDPIDAMTSPVGLAGLALGGSAVARAGAGAGLSMGGRMMAGATEAATQAAPAVKYEVTKTLLTKMGMPESVATVTALAVSGYKRGAKPATVAEEAAPRAVRRRPPPPVTSPVETPPAVAAPPLPVTAVAAPVPAASSAAAQLASRAGALTDVEAQAVDGLVRQGYDRDQVLQALAAKKAAPVSPRVKLTAPETAVIQQLMKTGKTPEEATAAVMAMRRLSSGLPTSAQVTQNVADRNATGRWPE